jgi:hypothetical protein
MLKIYERLNLVIRMINVLYTHVNINNIVSNNPGPSHYEIKPLINGRGYNFLSKFKSNNAFSNNGKKNDGSRNNFIPLII